MALRIPVPSERYVVLNSTSPPAWVYESGPSGVPQSIADTMTSLTNLTVTEESIRPPLAPLVDTIISFENCTLCETLESRPPPTPLAVEARLPSKSTRVGDCKPDRHHGKFLGKRVTRKLTKLMCQCKADGCRIPPRGPKGHRFCIFHGCDGVVETGEHCANRRAGSALQCAEHVPRASEDNVNCNTASDKEHLEEDDTHHVLEVPLDAEFLSDSRPALHRVKSSPLLFKNLLYELPGIPSPPPRNASYHGFTEAERQRQVPASPGSQHSRLSFAEEKFHRLKELKEEYRRQEVDKYLVEQAGFECKKRRGECVIIRGGFKEFEAKAIMQQPVSPVKLLILQAERRVTPWRIA